VSERRWSSGSDGAEPLKDWRYDVAVARKPLWWMGIVASR
jgi:hypothetical protein